MLSGRAITMQGGHAPPPPPLLVAKCTCMQGTTAQGWQECSQDRIFHPVLMAEGPASNAMLRRLKTGSVTSVTAEARQLSVHAFREQKARVPDILSEL